MRIHAIAMIIRVSLNLPRIYFSPREHIRSFSLGSEYFVSFLITYHNRYQIII